MLSFPPCRLVFAEELLLAGLGPRSAFGRDRQGRARAPWEDGVGGGVGQQEGCFFWCACFFGSRCWFWVALELVFEVLGG